MSTGELPIKSDPIRKSVQSNEQRKLTLLPDRPSIQAQLQVLVEFKFICMHSSKEVPPAISHSSLAKWSHPQVFAGIV